MFITRQGVTYNIGVGPVVAGEDFACPENSRTLADPAERQENGPWKALL